MSSPASSSISSPNFSPLTPDDRGFIDYLMKAEAISFGDEYKFRSGRTYKWMLDFSPFATMADVSYLGKAYARAITENEIFAKRIYAIPDKSLPAARQAVAELEKMDRKAELLSFKHKPRFYIEAVDEGRMTKEEILGGQVVGRPLEEGESVLIFDDTFGTGGNLFAADKFLSMLFPKIKRQYTGVQVAVDRMERDAMDIQGADQTFKQYSGVHSYSIVNAIKILQYALETSGRDSKFFQAVLSDIQNYGNPKAKMKLEEFAKALKISR